MTDAKLVLFFLNFPGTPQAYLLICNILWTNFMKYLELELINLFFLRFNKITIIIASYE